MTAAVPSSTCSHGYLNFPCIWHKCCNYVCSASGCPHTLHDVCSLHGMSVYTAACVGNFLFILYAQVSPKHSSCEYCTLHGPHGTQSAEISLLKQWHKIRSRPQTWNFQLWKHSLMLMLSQKGGGIQWSSDDGWFRRRGSEARGMGKCEPKKPRDDDGIRSSITSLILCLAGISMFSSCSSFIPQHYYFPSIALG